jgi:hypothetical protein
MTNEKKMLDYICISLHSPLNYFTLYINDRLVIYYTLINLFVENANGLKTVQLHLWGPKSWTSKE